MSIKISNLKTVSNIRFGPMPPTVEPIVYPLNTNIMTTEYFEAIDVNATSISPEYDIGIAKAYLTDYISDATKDYDHFLTGEFWGIPRNNSVIFRFTQPEEVDTVSIQFGNMSLAPGSIRLYTWDGSIWQDIGGTTGTISNTSVSFSAVSNSGDIFKVEMTDGDSSYFVDPNKFIVKLR